MTVQSLLLRIRRRETPFFAMLYRLAKSGRAFEFPVVGPIHRTLYYEREARRAAWASFRRVVYDTPLFKSRCEHVGPHLYLEGGIPVVMGHLRIRIGRDVKISGTTTFSAASRAVNPILDIGDHSYIGYQVGIAVGERVSLGRHVLLANRVFVAGDDGHPIDPVARRAEPGSGTGVVIVDDDAWIGESAVILKNVRIGRGAVVAAAAIVTADVPAFSVVAGNPARVVKEIERGAGG